MCRVTYAETAVSPTLCRKRSSLSSSSRSSSSSSIGKRVSFDDKIHVHSIRRLQYEELREVFYCPNDYRRFRSDTCLELLDQQFPQENPLVNMGKKLLQGLRRERKQTTMNAADYPWMASYHPQEYPAGEQVVDCRSKIGASEARRMVEELAFL